MEDEQQPSQRMDDDQLEASSDDRRKSVGQSVIRMESSSMKEARSHYEAYAGQQGFWIKQRSSKKGRTHIDAVTSVQYACAREGTHREGTGVKNVRTTSTIQNECPAQMRVTIDKYLEKWKVTTFNDMHNHKFITPTKRHMMRSNRNMPNAVKKLAEAFDREHMTMSKLSNIFGGNTTGAASCGYGLASSQAQSDDRIDVDAGFNPLERSILDPKVSQTKGHKRESRGKEVASTSGRIKSGIEMATQGQKRLCRSCQKLVNHDKINCPLNPNSKRRKQMMIS